MKLFRKLHLILATHLTFAYIIELCLDELFAYRGNMVGVDRALKMVEFMLNDS